MATTINADTSDGLKLTADTSGEIELQSSGSTKVTMDTSGNLGIGTSSPTNKLSISGNESQRIDIANTSLTDAGEIVSFQWDNNADFTIQGRDSAGGFKANWYRITSTATDGLADEHIWYTGSSTERMRIDSSANLLFNSGYGSVATAYGCRAWVNFNGTGTAAIRGSGNVSSITDNGTGDYTVNFATAMPDANYSPVVTLYSDKTGAGIFGLIGGINALATGSFQIDTIASASSFAYFDTLIVSVAVFR